MKASSSGTSTASIVILISGLLSIAGALAVILSGYGYQWGWWGLGIGLRTLIPYGSLFAVAGGIIAFVVYMVRKSKVSLSPTLPVIGLVITLVAGANFGYWYLEVQKGYPPIHDISTDTVNPPEFVAIAQLRADAPNPVEYQRGEGVAAAQAAFYDDLETLYTNESYYATYSRALATAREMSWEMVEESRAEGRIEAYHKLPWFGFIDDVVIRVDTTETGAKVDIRSKSRVGRGDLGVNAKRIRNYLDEFED